MCVCVSVCEGVCEEGVCVGCVCVGGVCVCVCVIKEGVCVGGGCVCEEGGG